MLRIGTTYVELQKLVSGGYEPKPYLRLLLTDPPLISNDPVSYAPGQQIILSDARPLYEALKAVYEPQQGEQS